jgi:hypothetical protein
VCEHCSGSKKTLSAHLTRVDLKGVVDAVRQSFSKRKQRKSINGSGDYCMEACWKGSNRLKL